MCHKIVRGCVKRLQRPVSMYELTRPDTPFQKLMRTLRVQKGLCFQGNWLRRPMETQQWERTSLAFSHSLSYQFAFRGTNLDESCGTQRRTGARHCPYAICV